MKDKLTSELKQLADKIGFVPTTAEQQPRLYNVDDLNDGDYILIFVGKDKRLISGPCDENTIAKALHVIGTNFNGTEYHNNDLYFKFMISDYNLNCNGETVLCDEIHIHSNYFTNSNTYKGEYLSKTRTFEAEFDEEFMKDYGYTYEGLTPVGYDTAKYVWDNDLGEVCILRPDGSESVIEDVSQFDEAEEYKLVYGIKLN